MKDSGVGKEIGFVSHLAAVITMTVFSAMLIVLNIILGWEKWMIPVVAAGAVICLVMHISGKGSPRMRIYFYALFLIFEMFYYTVNIDAVNDSAALIVILAFIFSMSGERLLIFLGTLGGLAGIVLHICLVGERGELALDASSIVRSAWQIILAVLGAVLADRISAAWFGAEKQYRRRIDAIIEENERANNFLANVSHEIRTPVNAVMGLAAIMEKEDIPDGIRANVSAIAEAGHRVADQIGDIMDYTEIDMKHLSVSKERYMINSVVNDLISQLRFTEDYGHDLVVDLSPDTPAELVGDDSKIKKILRHLITNGFKFTRDGGVYVHIFAKKREYGVNLVLEVTDTGVGMTEQEVEHIYEKFYQADSGRSRTVGGLGLGIPIVNGLARAMGGFIHIESVPGNGSVVRVSVPQEVADGSPCMTVADKDSIFAVGFLGFLTTGHPRIKEFHMEMVEHLVSGLGITFHRVKSREDLENIVQSCSVTHLFVGTGEYDENREYIDGLAESMRVILVEDRDHSGTAGQKISILKKPFYGTQVANLLDLSYVSSPAPVSERMTCPGVRVLVVDDEPMNLLVARGIFETYGMTVDTAASGAEALGVCADNDYDIIFMDHMMPGMDGVEAMRRLRADAGRMRKELCIVALTANAISSAKEMFLSEGFDAFLPKPIELMELERVLKHVLPRSAIVYEAHTGTTSAAAPSAEEKPEAAAAPADTQSQPETAEDGFAALGDIGVDISEGLMYCQNDEDFYREILAEYAKDSAEKLSTLEGFFRESEWKDYAIRVHSVKSTSKTIGADELSEKAKKLELAAKSEDVQYIKDHHAAFMADYGRLMELINGISAGTGADGSDGSGVPDDDPDEISEFTPGGSV